MPYVISLLMGYLLGNFQTSYILAKSVKHIDIREFGSGNAGSTNALRVMGKKYGILTFVGDLSKAIIAVVAARILFDSQFMGLIAGFGVVMGHNWPVFLGFKGGKGIASTLGLMIAFDPRIGLPAFLITFIVIKITKYVSVGSLLLITLFPVGALIFHPGDMKVMVVALILMAIGFYRHRANIQRLLNGTENKVGRSSADNSK